MEATALRTPALTQSWTLAGLCRAARIAEGCTLEPDIEIRDVTDDSRAARAGSCFVAVRGGTFDGHDFVQQVVAAGASAVVAEAAVRVPPHVRLVRVSDTQTALARLAAAYYGLSGRSSGAALRLIGVTGTNGKSTTCELLRAVLNAAGQPAALLGTIRYDLIDEVVTSSMTTPGPLKLCEYLARAAEAGASWAVMETSSHALEQRRADGLRFDAGIFTNLTGDHLDYHGDMAHYLAAKKRLFDLLEADAVAVVNADDASAEALLGDCRARIGRFSLTDRGEWRAVEHDLSAEGSRFEIIGPGVQLPLECRLPGRHNIQNAMGAAVASLMLGIEAEAVREGIRSVEFVRGRLEGVRVPGQRFAVFVDYAHTDDALRNVLFALRPLTPGRLICVFGCGGDRDRTKRPRMARAVGELADHVIVTSDNPRNEDPMGIIEEILPGFGYGRSYSIQVEPDRRRAIAAAVGLAGANDTLLIAGKGHEDYQIIKGDRLDFDDVQVARTALEQRFPPPERAA